MSKETTTVEEAEKALAVAADHLAHYKKEIEATKRALAGERRTLEQATAGVSREESHLASLGEHERKAMDELRLASVALVKTGVTREGVDLGVAGSEGNTTEDAKRFRRALRWLLEKASHTSDECVKVSGFWIRCVLYEGADPGRENDPEPKPETPKSTPHGALPMYELDLSKVKRCTTIDGMWAVIELGRLGIASVLLGVLRFHPENTYYSTPFMIVPTEDLHELTVDEMEQIITKYLPASLHSPVKQRV